MMKTTANENKVSQWKIAYNTRCHFVFTFLMEVLSVSASSLCVEAESAFVKVCNKKTPCDKTKGSTKLFGMSVIETKLVMSILKVVQKPIKYSPPQTKKYESKIVAMGNLSKICLNIILECKAV